MLLRGHQGIGGFFKGVGIMLNGVWRAVKLAASGALRNEEDIEERFYM